MTAHPPDSPAWNDAETRQRVITLAFAGDGNRFERFLERLRCVTPPGAEVILRGSAVTGQRYEDGAPFDADGPGTSDLDVTFVGGDMTRYWMGFYIPAMHTLPLSEEHPNAAPALVSLRNELCELVGRPVNLQATRDIVQFMRDVLMNQPYHTLIPRREDEEDAARTAAS